jgi:taurine dioxygenase
LYAISGSSCGIVGMDEDEAIALLVDLKKFATQAQFVQRARAETGCIVIWDNFAVLHSATPTEYSDEEGKRRLLHRISTRGLPPVCGKSFAWPGRLAA